MATSYNVYAFDCGTTNWRVSCLSCQDIISDNGTSKIEPLGQPQPVALTTFSTGGHFLPAALLLNDKGEVQSYGQNAYDLAYDPENLPYLRDDFKLCIGNDQPISPLEPSQRYSHQEALRYTQLLLSQILQQLDREKPGSLARESGNFFLFAHPVHWGRELSDGEIEGQILADFAQTIKEAFPTELRDNIHFVPEPEGALLSLMHSGQLTDVGNKHTLVVDVGGGTTDFVVGQWTSEGLQDIRHYGGLHGGGLFDHNLAEYLADVLKVPPEQRELAWSELRHYGQRLKETLSRQIQLNPSVSVTMKIMLELPGKDGESVFLSQKINFSNSDFESQAQNSITGLNNLILKALVEMDLRKSDIAQVVLVGGGSHLYLVPQLLKETFGNSVSVAYDVTAEQTVVQGVALWLTRPKPKTTHSSTIVMPKTRRFQGHSNIKIRITTLGAGCCGKTSFLLGMYAIMQDKNRIFNLATNNLNEHEKLLEMWNCLLKNCWPNPTMSESEKNAVLEYGFTLNCNSEPIMSFQYPDYRGGLLRYTTKPGDTQQLFEYAKKSDCLFLCVPGEYLEQAIVETNGEPNFGVRQKVSTRGNLTRIKALIRELQQKLKPTNNYPFPVAIVITKYDLCMERGKEAIVQDIKELFVPLFQPYSGWLVMVCPVSLGKELVTNPDRGEINPINFHIPLLFAAYSLFKKRHLSEHQENDKKWMNLLAKELSGAVFYLSGKEVYIN